MAAKLERMGMGIGDGKPAPPSSNQIQNKRTEGGAHQPSPPPSSRKKKTTGQEGVATNPT